MRMRTLGKTGYQVSEIGLGCWQLGGDFGPVAEETADAILREGLNSGITFFDTADVYGDGRSERLCGEHLSGQPGVRVATKVGRTGDLYPDGYTLDRVFDHLKQSADRLRTDRLDLVQLHCVPPAVLGPDLFETMDRAVSDGLTAAWGASVETLDEARTCLGAQGCATLQIIFNLFRQDAATELLPQAADQDVGIIVRLPLASGLLTGKMSKETRFDPSDHRNYNRDGEAFSAGETFSGLPFERGVELSDAMLALRPDDMTAPGFALRWLLDHDAVSTVIAGASRPKQARRNAEASDLPRLGDAVHERARSLYEEEVRPLVRVPI